jgi:hypothetical protein
VTRPKRALLAAAAADLALIVAFAALGRRTHDSGDGIGAVLTVAAPFLIGYPVAAAVARLDRAPLSLRRGAAVALLTAALGLALRRLVFDRGIALAFIIVTMITLTVLLVGWRIVVRFRRIGNHAGAVAEFVPPRPPSSGAGLDDPVRSDRRCGSGRRA